MTPKELMFYIQDFNEKQKALNEEKVTLAYATAYWQRVEKLPALKEILGKNETVKKKMTNEEMLNEVKKLNAAFDGTTY